MCVCTFLGGALYNFCQLSKKTLTEEVEECYSRGNRGVQPVPLEFSSL